MTLELWGPFFVAIISCGIAIHRFIDFRLGETFNDDV